MLPEMGSERDRPMYNSFMGARAAKKIPVQAICNVLAQSVLRDFKTVARLVIRDLKTDEVVDCSDGNRIVGL